MPDLLKQNGSHGLHAEAMRKPSNSPLPPSLTFSAEEKGGRNRHDLKLNGIGIASIAASTAGAAFHQRQLCKERGQNKGTCTTYQEEKLLASHASAAPYRGLFMGGSFYKRFFLGGCL